MKQQPLSHLYHFPPHHKKYYTVMIGRVAMYLLLFVYWQYGTCVYLIC